MSALKNDRLSQIKLKYGYNSQSHTSQNTNVQQFLSDISAKKRD